MRCTVAPALVLGILGVLFTTTPAAAEEPAAVVATRAAAGKSPAIPEARLALARALRRAGEGTEALAELRRGLALGPKGDLQAALLWEAARAHVDLREFGPAMASCRDLGKVAGGASRRAAGHVCAAEAHLLWRRASEALTELDKAEKDLPAARPEVSYAAKMVLGRARELEAKDAEAEGAYASAVAMLPERSEAHVALGTLQRRAVLAGKGEVSRALASLRRAVELDPADPAARLALGRALPSGSAEQVASLERAVAERPSDPEALRALAEAYVDAKRFPEARRTAEAVLRVTPNDAFAQVVAGRVALGEGKADEALRAGAAAFERQKNFAPAKLLVADANAKKGEIDLAIEAYQAAVGLDHSDPTALLRATSACLAAGRTTSAKAFAERATRDFPSSAAAWEALGDALVADGEPSLARKMYETAKGKPEADAAALDRKLAAPGLR